ALSPSTYVPFVPIPLLFPPARPAPPAWPRSPSRRAAGAGRAATRAVRGAAYPETMDEDLFSLSGDAPAPRTLSDRNRDHRAPLAVRMRPRSLDEVVGQHDALEPGSPLRRLVSTDDTRTAPASVILWGPPGTGKTTLAYVVAQSGDREFVEISAVLAGVKDIR